MCSLDERVCVSGKALCYSRQPAVNRVELKGLRDLNTPVLPSSLSARTMGRFPSTPPSLHPSLSLPLLKISADGKAPPTASPLLSACVHSLFISFCLHRPLSHLLYSLHWGESTHLPSCRATPLPSISSYSPLGGDLYQHPPSFLSSLSTSSSLYTFLHLYLSSCDIFSFSPCLSLRPLSLISIFFTSTSSYQFMLWPTSA